MKENLKEISESPLFNEHKKKKVFKEGDIVYFVKGYSRYGYKGINLPPYIVGFGMVSQQIGEVVYVDYLEKAEDRYIDGMPIDEFVNNSKLHEWKKLPKGWTYDMWLYKRENRTSPDYEKLYKEIKPTINEPELLKRAYDLGLIVKSGSKFRGEIKIEVSKHGTYRVYPNYPMLRDPAYTSIDCRDLYLTYEEAQNEVDKIFAEINRQASLTDYEWAVEQIDKTLDRWQLYSGATDDEKNKYRQFLLNLKNVEDVITTLSGDGAILWKYTNNVKWRTITIT